MPKEMIHCADFGRDIKLDGGGTSRMPMDLLKVGWMKDPGHVTLAVCQTVTNADGSKSVIEHEWDLGLDPDAPADAAEMWEAGTRLPRYIHLDRHGINRLIRTLRRARDDAFGKDA